MMPLVPFLFLALADHWLRMPVWARVAIAVPAVVHSWVLTAFREPVNVSWRLFMSEGPQLSWFRVLGLTSGSHSVWLGTWYVPSMILALTLAVVACIWQYGARLEAAGIAAIGRADVDRGRRSDARRAREADL
jgi:hypothetical protein